jgi:hypothetical protein
MTRHQSLSDTPIISSVIAEKNSMAFADHEEKNNWRRGTCAVSDRVIGFCFHVYMQLVGRS